MQALPKVLLHSNALANFPSTGQRRDMLLKRLRQIQVSPELGGDFQWPDSTKPNPVQVSTIVGYAISWIQKDDQILVLDIRGQ